MDLFITLRDGRTTPMSGVTAVRSIDTAGTATQHTLSAITNGSANVTVTSTATIRPGASVFGSGIPTGATVTAITSGTVFVMSAVATATIASLTLTITAVTDADMKLLKIDSGWYRDIFSSNITSASVVYSGPGVNSSVTSNSVTTNTGTIGPPTPSIVDVDTTGTVTTGKQSDEVDHADLRQATWLESLWAFDCTTDAVLGPTLTLYYRKYDVIGFCNVAPSL